MKVKSLSCARLLATTWTAAHQAPPSMGFSRQEYWSGEPLPSSGSMAGEGQRLEGELQVITVDGQQGQDEATGH